MRRCRRLGPQERHTHDMPPREKKAGALLAACLAGPPVPDGARNRAVLALLQRASPAQLRSWVHFVDAAGTTALHAAVMRCGDHVVERLLQNLPSCGANANVEMRDGQPPLALAALAGSASKCRFGFGFGLGLGSGLG